ncbi:hypothetical protein HK101_008597 [Irineochytrium annulatum]|nr:hypothetical protein HK101_008597 [Irineochytrium annulatum]
MLRRVPRSASADKVVVISDDTPAQAPSKRTSVSQSKTNSELAKEKAVEASAKQAVTEVSQQEDDDCDLPENALMPPPTNSNPAATKALQKELMRMIRSQNSMKEGERWFFLDPMKVTNLYQWQVRLINFEDSLPLFQDMIIEGIADEPAVSVNAAVRWVSTYSVEAVCLQVRLALMNMDPVPARLDPHDFRRPYNAQEAMSAFIRVARIHGWEVPAGWSNLFSN